MCNIVGKITFKYLNLKLLIILKYQYQQTKIFIPKTIIQSGNTIKSIMSVTTGKYYFPNSILRKSLTTSGTTLNHIKQD